MTSSHLLTCALLIPAGLAGIGAGLHEMLLASDALPAFLDQFRSIFNQLQPWLEGLFCLTLGVFLLLLAGILGLRGLQS
ncbi:MAG: hypothetical protein V2J10_03030 [Wenzhouxiangella sp.]|jgi:hypothetical protein|nr:hypothetical protein [Wenzhouxiangella sp.]